MLAAVRVRVRVRVTLIQGPKNKMSSTTSKMVKKFGFTMSWISGTLHQHSAPLSPPAAVVASPLEFDWFNAKCLMTGFRETRIW